MDDNARYAACLAATGHTFVADPSGQRGDKACADCGVAMYRPGLQMVGEMTPQSNPEMFSDSEIMAEIRHLLNLNKRYGTHILRCEAYLKLGAFIEARRAGA